MTTDIICQKRSYGELFTILGFQLALTGLLVSLLLWISSGMHADINRIRIDMDRMHNDFKSEHAHHAARQDAVTARIDLAYNLLYDQLRKGEKP